MKRNGSNASWKNVGFLGLAIVQMAGCGGGEAGAPQEELIGTFKTFEEFERQISREPETGIYIIEGDIPVVGREELRRYYEENVQQGALTVYQPYGTDARWNDTQKLELTYCVSQAFGANYFAVVRAMSEAASDWESSAKVNFVHRADQDGACTSSNGNVVFDVSPTSGQTYLARAFFPNYARATRNVLIDSSSFEPRTWSLGGILKHELGHTLGFRHEHVRPEAYSGCTESNDWRPLTPYDSASVMHYPQCNGTNTGDLVLTSLDRSGAANLYGSGGMLTLQRWATWQGDFWDGQKWMVGDFNGDGRDDLAKAFDDSGTGLISIDVHLSNGASFSIQRWATRQGNFWDTQRWVVGDFNGDGRDDLAKAFDDAGMSSIDVHLSNGASFSIQRWATRQGNHWDTQRWVAGDFNGDGRDDLAKAFDDAGMSSIDAHLSSGSSFGIQRWATRLGSHGDGQKWVAGDFNGDGRDDLAKAFDDGGMSSIDAHLSSGSSFGIQRWATRLGNHWDGQKWMAGDFNGDGKDDLAKAFDDAGSISIDIHPSTGTGFYIDRHATRQGSFWDGQKWMAGDFNGDGKDDLAKAFDDAGKIDIDVHKH